MSRRPIGQRPGRRALRAPHRTPRWARIVMALLLGGVVGVSGVSAAVVLTGRPASSSSATLVEPVPSHPPVTDPPVTDPPGTDPPVPDLPVTDPTGRPVRVPAREVLRRWDAARAAAWRHADPAALGRLYTTASVAGRRDVAALRAWTVRGVRVDRLTTQVLGLQVLDEGRRRLLLRVTDRLAAVTADGTRLPQDAVSTRSIELRWRGTWRVASVRDV